MLKNQQGIPLGRGKVSWKYRTVYQKNKMNKNGGMFNGWNK